MLDQKKLAFTNQKDLFYHIRQVRPHRCVICGKLIKEAISWCFAHILPKGMFPKLKLWANNIALVCSIECNKELDRRVSGHKYELEIIILAGNIPNLDEYAWKNNNIW